MVRVEVLAVGKELLIGRTLNTNAHWIGRRLALMGSMIRQMSTVDDDLEEIARALDWSLSRRPDFLIVVGGLGPTPDDMTLKGVAKGLGRRMVPNARAISMIKAHYAKRGIAGIEITPSRRKMSVLPAGSEPMMNNAGTAPGVRLVAGETVVFCLPGVPAEMRSIFRGSVEPEVRKSLGKLHRTAVSLKVEGVYESTIAPLIQAELGKHPGAYIKSHPRGAREGTSRIELDIVVVDEDEARAKGDAASITDEMVRAIQKEGGAVRSAEGPG